MSPLARSLLVSATTFLVIAAGTAAATTPTLDATWPTDGTVRSGAALSVTGTVSDADAAATVSLQYDLPTGWRTVSTVAPEADGSYAIPIPTNWLHHDLDHRVLLDGTDTATAPWTLDVTPRWRPEGASSQWLPTKPGHVLRWDACDVITWRANTRGAPKGALRVTKAAVRRTAQATGLRFAFQGRTSFIPSRRVTSDRPDLVVAWARPSQSDLLQGQGPGVAGVAGVRISFSSREIDGEPQELIVEAGIVMNRKQPPPRLGFRGGNSLGAILMHELGHAVGLGHVPQDSKQMMVPVGEPSHTPLWGAGDLAGMEYLGLKQGCGDVPAASRRTVRSELLVTAD